MVSSTVGWSTSTGWKRRSSAASFSMCLRYSSSVVAPMVCSSPRASIGLSMFEASSEPSAAPAPTTVCSSSMNRTTLPSASVTSFSTALRRSSNSPRYLAPATSAPMSRPMMRLSLRPSGTSPRTMRCARPSTTAVLPTPGSPMSTGLFLVRRDSTWMTRRISSSRPITGSRRCCAGELGEVAAVALERLVLALGALIGDALVAAHRREASGERGRRSRRGATASRRRGDRFDSETIASSRCSVLTNSSLKRPISASAFVEHGSQPRRDAGLAAAVGLGQLLERLSARSRRPPPDRRSSCAGRRDDAARLLDERRQQVLGLDLRVAGCARRAAAPRGRLPGPFRYSDSVHVPCFVLLDVTRAPLRVVLRRPQAVLQPRPLFSLASAS